MRSVLAVLLVACTKPNPNRCCVDEADCIAKDIPIGNACEPGLVCRGNQCIAQPCSSSDSCDLAAPFCIDELCAEQCVEDGHCPGFGGDSAAAFCVGGGCVTCRDSADCSSSAAPFCDAGACRACAAHSECASDLCDFDTGTCIDESTITYATPAGSASSDCTKADPCTLDRALAIIDTRLNLKLAPGDHVFTGGFFDRNVPVNFYGPAKIVSDLANSYSERTTRIRDVELKSINVSYKNTTAPRPTLDLRRIVLIEGAISGSGANITIRSSRLQASGSLPYLINGSGTMTPGGTIFTVSESLIDGGIYGIQLGNYSSLTLTNSILKNQSSNAIKFLGTDTNPTSASSPSTVAFTTFHNTVWTCPGGSLLFSAKNNIILNQKFGAPADTVSGTACRHDYDLISPQATPPAGANNILATDPKFVNAAAGDFHLMIGSPAIDAADPAATEAADYEGTSRPQGAGRDLGALEHKP